MASAHVFGSHSHYSAIQITAIRIIIITAGSREVPGRKGL
jgi:hypothetical protein